MDKKTKSLDKKQLKAKDFEIDDSQMDPFADNDIFSFDDDLGNPPTDVFSDEEEKTAEAIEDEQITDDNPKESSIMTPQHVAPKPPLTLIEKEKDMDRPLEVDQNKSNAKVIILIVTILVVLSGLVVGGLLVYRNAMSGENATPQVIESDTPAPTITPTPTPDPEATTSATPGDSEELDIASLSINVLNGSGIPGKAGTLADVLTEAGFENVDTGNADEYDFESTEISVKAGQTELYDFLEAALEDSYTITKGDELDEDSEFDAVITVGKK